MGAGLPLDGLVVQRLNDVGQTEMGPEEAGRTAEETLVGKAGLWLCYGRVPSLGGY